MDELTTEWLRTREPEDRVPILGLRVRACREYHGWSQDELAKHAGTYQGEDRKGNPVARSVLKQTIDKVERGEQQRIAYGRAAALARALAPEPGDPTYLLRWLVVESATLRGPSGPDSLPEEEQVVRYFASWKDLRGMSKVVVALAHQQGEVTGKKSGVIKTIPQIRLEDGALVKGFLVRGQD